VDSSHLDGLEWRRSSKCDGGACVEVAELNTVIMIRDTNEPDHTPLAVSRDVWQVFVSRVRAGHFDVL
jgi:hypothetical protein